MLSFYIFYFIHHYASSDISLHRDLSLSADTSAAPVASLPSAFLPR